jgi:hypothetical protein
MPTSATVEGIPFVESPTEKSISEHAKDELEY